MMSGALALDGISLHGLGEQWGFPLHVVSAARLRDNARRFLAAPPGSETRCEVFYSYKTNPVPGVLSELHALGVGAEVISHYELWLARRLGVPAEKIVFNGPAKSEAAIREAIGAGIQLLNLNHREEIAVVAGIAAQMNRRVRVGRAGLRLRRLGGSIRCPGGRRTRPRRLPGGPSLAASRGRGSPCAPRRHDSFRTRARLVRRTGPCFRRSALPASRAGSRGAGFRRKPRDPHRGFPLGARREAQPCLPSRCDTARLRVRAFHRSLPCAARRSRGGVLPQSRPPTTAPLRRAGARRDRGRADAARQRPHHQGRRGKDVRNLDGRDQSGGELPFRIPPALLGQPCGSDRGQDTHDRRTDLHARRHAVLGGSHAAARTRRLGRDHGRRGLLRPLCHRIFVSTAADRTHRRRRGHVAPSRRTVRGSRGIRSARGMAGRSAKAPE